MPDHSHPPTAGSRQSARTLAWVASVVIVAALVTATAWVFDRRAAYAEEIERLRASMTAVERQRADEILGRKEHTVRVALELLRRQARLEPALHLAVTVDSSRMYLEREGALLRDMAVHIGPDRVVGTPPDTVRLAPPRGLRTVVRVLTEQDVWIVPEWVYRDRGLPVDSTRAFAGALGPVAILLEGGAVIYSLPHTGPLRDPSYVLSGAVRASPDDMRAILPNLTPGMRVYFH